jgi:hypothetical protein
VQFAVGLGIPGSASPDFELSRQPFRNTRTFKATFLKEVELR